MKILLDECIPQGLCKSFREHACHAARQAGFGGKKNGELLKLAEAAGFEVLITVDRNVSYQQNFHGRSIALVVLEVQSNRLKDLLLYLPACLSALRSMKPGQVLRVD